MRDHLPIQYPTGLSLPHRRLCRKIIVATTEVAPQARLRIVACSGGIDSTVLVHAVSQGLRIRPSSAASQQIKASAIYINHNLREAEVAAEAEHVQQLNQQYLTFNLPPIELQIGHGSSLQERARNARYQALVELGQALQADSATGSEPPQVAIFTGHTQSDQVETRLMNFLKGRSSGGIPAVRELAPGITVYRPLLGFSRQQIETYATSFQLTWMEDSSNSQDKYTRNKIRHHLVPWIEKHINPGLTKTLGR